ncbi:MAG: magnesium transporter [Gammaproteobacteria bacterium]|nr:magnesium transporter [Gammaproteobacteria bacterium]MCP5136508.1 magnesium transporter [Gammaproteobacteria bacterium]
MSAHSDERLQANVDHVVSLLHRNDMVEALVHAQKQPRQELVESIVHRQQLAALQSKLRRMHFADLAHVLEVLPLEERGVVWSLLADPIRAEALLEVNDAVRGQLIDSTPPEELLRAVAGCDADDLAYLREELPADVFAQAMEGLADADRHWVSTSMSYAEDSVGHLMSREIVTVTALQTIGEAIVGLRSHAKLPHNTDKIFVLDARGALSGVLFLEDLLLEDPARSIAEAQRKSVVSFKPEDSAADAALAFERYDLTSAPVVNARGKLLGRLSIDELMDYLHDEAHEDVLNIAGLMDEEDLFANLRSAIRNRWLWLFVNLITAFIASQVIDAFSDAIGQLVALAALMPIVASVGGNTGNQTTALVVRGLAMNQISLVNLGPILRKELSVALVSGLFWGGVVGLFAGLIYHQLALSVVIAVALLLNLVVAALTGVLVPFALHRFGRDPAMGASVLLTFTTDSMGFLIFLGLASHFLI